jgi:hypothetical protein
MKSALRIVILILLLCNTLIAEDMVVVNSVDGRDVLSAVYYANVKDLPVRFMAVPGGSADVLAAKVGTNHSVLLIESEQMPVSKFVKNTLENNGNQVEIYPSANGGQTNLELAKKSGADSFILVDSAYSDSALSVLSYAALNDAYVLLIDKNNVNDIIPIVSGHDITIFGYVDSEVKDALSSTNPRQIGNGKDKFQDNIDIVKLTMSEHGKKRAIATDGTVLEDAITRGDSPILLVGRVIPDNTYDFIKNQVASGSLTGLVLVGGDLTYSLYDMRERIHTELEAQGNTNRLGITIKFAQSLPGSGGSVMGLDTFSLPAYKPKLEITELSYNQHSKRVMLSIKNTGDGAAYFTSEVRVKVDGSDHSLLGNPDATLIERGASSAQEFDVDLSTISEGDISADAVIRYGSSPKALEDFISSSGPLASISYVDESDVQIRGASYDGEKKAFKISVKNNKDSPAYVMIKLEAKVDGDSTILSGSQERVLDANAIYVEEIPIELSESDIEDNKKVKVMVQYGGRAGFLTKTKEKTVDLQSGSSPSEGDDSMALLGLGIAGGLGILVLGAIVIVVVIALFLYFKGKKR